MLATCDTVPDVVSIEPGAPTPTPASPIGSIPASSSAALIASASSSVTASGPPARGVSRRALPSTTDPPSVTTAWIFVPPRSRPPIILGGARPSSLTEAGARRRRSASGSPARSIPRRCDARDRAGRSGYPNVSTITGRLLGGRCRARPAPQVDIPMPFGHEAIPSAQAASSMLWAARPASKSTGPLPATTIATTRPAPRTFSGTWTAARRAARSAPSRSARRTSRAVRSRRVRRACRRRARAGREVLGQPVRQRSPLVATAGDREQRVHSP